jgi:hypothetical protein
MDFFMLDAQNMVFHGLYNETYSWSTYSYMDDYNLPGLYWIDKPVDWDVYNEYQDYEVLLTNKSFKVIGSGYPYLSIDMLIELYHLFYIFVLSWFDFILIPLCVIWDYIYDIYVVDSTIINLKILKLIIFYVLAMLFYHKSLINSYNILYYDYNLIRNINNKGNTYIYYLYLYLLKIKK